MSSKQQRINDGIERLVGRLLVEIPNEDADEAVEREANAIEFVTEYLDR